MHQTGNNTGVLPEVVGKLGGGRTSAVKVTVNGFAYRSTIATGGDRPKGGRCGRGDARARRGARTIEVPANLQAALDADTAAKAYFATLSYSKQHRHIDPINAAKTPETRARRIEKSVARFHDGKK